MKRRSHVGVVGTALMCVGLPALAQLVTDFPTGDVFDLVSGPDGIIWFSFFSTIGALSPRGNIRPHTVPYAEALTVDPHGNVWFVDNVHNAIGRLALDHSAVEFTIPSPAAPNVISSSADGTVWFGDQGGKIGRVDPAGRIQTFPLPENAQPTGITAGPDGAIWFATVRNGVGRITSSGGITMYSANTTDSKIGSGPDGALWFTSGQGLGRITTSGLVTQFPTTLRPACFAKGPDGTLWFTETDSLSGGPGMLGRITTGGIVEFALSSDGIARILTGPVAVGTDGAVYVAEYTPSGYFVGRVDGNLLALNACPPTPDPPLNPGLESHFVDFESFAAGTSLASISVPGMSFRGQGVTGSVQDTGQLPPCATCPIGPPLQTISGKALVWKQQLQCNCGDYGLYIDFPQDVVRFRARYAVRAYRGQHGLTARYQASSSSGFFQFRPDDASEACPFPCSSVSYWAEGVLEYPNDLLAFFPGARGSTLRQYGLELGGFGDTQDLLNTTVLLDDIEITFAAPCRYGIPEITSQPADDITPVASSQVIPLVWTPVSGLSGTGHYVVETSWACDFSTLESTQIVFETSAEVDVPSVTEQALLYVRVYPEDSCGTISNLRGLGSSRIFKVSTSAAAAGPRSSVQPIGSSRPSPSPVNPRP
jgi:virginiamycin B lyase